MHTHTLDNGLLVVSERMEARSVAIGLWVGTGACHEVDGESGMSHFIEHMLFKGTQKRCAKDIAAEMDGVGGQLNAFTGKECTCFHAKVMDAHLPIAGDLLADMLLHSRFDPGEIRKEQGVVVEELVFGGYKEIQGIWTATRQRMRTVGSDSETIMEIREVAYNTPIAEDIFLPQDLKR